MNRIELLNKRIVDIPISRRTIRILVNNNIATVRDLTCKSERDLTKFNSFGPICLKEVIGFLRFVGLELGKEYPTAPIHPKSDDAASTIIGWFVLGRLNIGDIFNLIKGTERLIYYSPLSDKSCLMEMSTQQWPSASHNAHSCVQAASAMRDSVVECLDESLAKSPANCTGQYFREWAKLNKSICSNNTDIEDVGSNTRPAMDKLTEGVYQFLIECGFTYGESGQVLEKVKRKAECLYPVRFSMKLKEGR